MTSAPADAPRLLLVGGTGGFVGRSLRPLLGRTYRIRSVHRRPIDGESPAVEFRPADVGTTTDWPELLEGVDAVVNLAWYRAGSRTRFVRLREGLERLIEAASAAGIRRFIQLSVPPAPSHLEASFPYLVEKRRVDGVLARSGLSYRILRPTMLYGPGDVLLSVMRRQVRRYGRFPMFGDGRYHVSPLFVGDLARIVAAELSGADRGTRDLGGPDRLEYRALTDRLFAAEGRQPRYVRLSERGGVRLARLMELVGLDLLYAYEVEWLVSDLLGLPPAEPEGRGLLRVTDYLSHGAPVDPVPGEVRPAS